MDRPHNKVSWRRCWWRMLEMKCVGGNYEMLVTVSALLKPSPHWNGHICHHNFKLDITFGLHYLSPTSIFSIVQLRILLTEIEITVSAKMQSSLKICISHKLWLIIRQNISFHYKQLLLHEPANPDPDGLLHPLSRQNISISSKWRLTGLYHQFLVLLIPYYPFLSISPVIFRFDIF